METTSATNAEPVEFSRRQLQELGLTLRLLRYRLGLDSREDIVADYDKKNGVRGLKGIGKARGILLKKALSLGPGRWEAIVALACGSAMFMPATRAEAQAGKRATGPETAIVMLYAYGDYPGGGANDHIRSFRATGRLEAAVEEAKAHFDAWASGTDQAPTELAAHITVLNTATGGMALLARWEASETGVYSANYGPRSWTNFPEPAYWGKYLDLVQDGTHAGMVETGGLFPELSPNGDNPRGLL